MCAQKRAGFTFIELLLALAISGVLLGALASATLVFTNATKFTGIEDFGEHSYPISPDVSTRSNAGLLGAELLSVSGRSTFVLACAAPLSEDSILSLQRLPRIPVDDPTTLRDPVSNMYMLSSMGAVFEGEGYSVIIFGYHTRIIGVLNVRVSLDASANGDPFKLYDVDLYGDYDEGYGKLYGYKFCSYSATSQEVDVPSFGSNSWKVRLPDPLVEDHHDNDFRERLTYEIVSPL